MFGLQRRAAAHLPRHAAAARPPDRPDATHDRSRHGGGARHPRRLPDLRGRGRPLADVARPRRGAARRGPPGRQGARDGRRRHRGLPVGAVVPAGHRRVDRGRAGHPRRRRPGRGHLAAVPRRHRRSWRWSRSSVVGVAPRTLGASTPTGRAGRGAATVWLRRVLGPLARLLIALGNAVTPGKGFRDGPFASEAELRELVDLAEAIRAHRGRRARDDPLRLRARRHHRPRGDGAAHRHGLHRATTRPCARRCRCSCARGFSRIPVVGEDLDDVVGIALPQGRRRAGLRRHPTRRPPSGSTTVMRPAHFVPESKPVDDLLREMQARRRAHRGRRRRVRRHRRAGHHRGHPRGDRRRDHRRVRPRGARGRGPRRRRGPGRRRAARRRPRRAVRRRRSRTTTSTPSAACSPRPRPGADPRLDRARWQGCA